MTKYFVEWHFGGKETSLRKFCIWIKFASLLAGRIDFFFIVIIPE